MDYLDRLRQGIQTVTEYVLSPFTNVFYGFQPVYSMGVGDVRSDSSSLLSKFNVVFMAKRKGNGNTREHEAPSKIILRIKGATREIDKNEKPEDKTLKAYLLSLGASPNEVTKALKNHARH